MSEQVLQAVFEELKTASGEKRTRLKQKHFISLYGSSSKLTSLTKQQILEELHKAGEICDNFRRQL